MSTCKTCKHWNTWPKGGPTVGECKRMRVEFDIDAMPHPNEVLVRINACQDDFSADALILTREAFGCTLHEPREG